MDHVVLVHHDNMPSSLRPNSPALLDLPEERRLHDGHALKGQAALLAAQRWNVKVEWHLPPISVCIIKQTYQAHSAPLLLYNNTDYRRCYQVKRYRITNPPPCGRGLLFEL